MLVVFEPRFDVVTAVSTCLESINSNNLISGQSRGERHFGISALELDLALRQSRRKLELLAGRSQKIGDDRHIGRTRAGFGFYRLWRSGIDRRLGEDVVRDRQRLATRAFAIA